jgi:hypothetical protein
MPLDTGLGGTLCIVEIDKKNTQGDSNHHSLRDIDVNILENTFEMERRIDQGYYPQNVDDLKENKTHEHA